MPTPSLEQGERIVEVLKQDRNSPIDVELQIAIIYAVVNNLLKDIDTSDIHSFENGLFEYLSASCDGLLEKIRTTGVLDAESEAELKAAIIRFKEKFLGKSEG